MKNDGDKLNWYALYLSIVRGYSGTKSLVTMKLLKREGNDTEQQTEITKVQLEELCKTRSKMEICKDLNIPLSYLNKLLKQYNIHFDRQIVVNRMKNKVRNTRNKSLCVNKGDRLGRDIYMLMLQGKTIEQITKELNICEMTLYRHIYPEKYSRRKVINE